MEATEWANGVHTLAFEPPDIFHCYVKGEVALEEAQKTIQVLTEEVLPKVGEAFALFHLEAGGSSYPSETRKFFSSIKPPWKAMCIVGGNPVSRAAANVAIRAMNLLSGNAKPMRMVKSQDEALAWFDEMRATDKAQAGKG